jgi:hypothetical protein
LENVYGIATAVSIGICFASAIKPPSSDLGLTHGVVEDAEILKIFGFRTSYIIKKVLQLWLCEVDRSFDVGDASVLSPRQIIGGEKKVR